MMMNTDQNMSQITCTGEIQSQENVKIVNKITNGTTCCVPDCRSSIKFKHSSFYPVRAEWKASITHYIQKHSKAGISQTSSMICGRHFKLCGLRQGFNRMENAVYFPYLDISVHRKVYDVPAESENEVKDSIMTESFIDSGELCLGSEVTIPPLEKERDIELSKRIRFPRNPSLPNNYDHTYAMTLQHITVLKYEYVKACEENEKRKAHIEFIEDKYEEGMKKLKSENRALTQANALLRSIRSNYFQRVLDDPEMLKFYTGFANMHDFDRFAQSLKPIYESASNQKHKKCRKPKIFNVTYELQLVLVLTGLRLGLMQRDLAFRFDVTPEIVTGLYAFWIKELSRHLEAESIKLNNTEKALNPSCVMNKRIIVECTQTFIKNEENKVVAGHKVYTRAKGLVEFAPNGVIVFVSDLYSSDVSEKELIARCKFPVEEYKNNNNNNKGSIAYAQQNRIRQIFFCVKNFKMLNGTFPNSIYDMNHLNCFWKICCFLTNFNCRPHTNKKPTSKSTVCFNS